jgi:hypothetical protein
MFKKIAELLQDNVEQLAEEGNVEKQYSVGLYYFKIKSYDTAFMWGWAAAQAGHIDDQGFLRRFLRYSIERLSEEKQLDVYVACSLTEKAFLSVAVRSITFKLN